MSTIVTISLPVFRLTKACSRMKSSAYGKADESIENTSEILQSSIKNGERCVQFRVDWLTGVQPTVSNIHRMRQWYQTGFSTCGGRKCLSFVNTKCKCEGVSAISKFRDWDIPIWKIAAYTQQTFFQINWTPLLCHLSVGEVDLPNTLGYMCYTVFQWACTVFKSRLKHILEAKINYLMYCLVAFSSCTTILKVHQLWLLETSTDFSFCGEDHFQVYSKNVLLFKSVCKWRDH